MNESLNNPRHLSATDLAGLGIQDLAFIKRMTVEDEIVYAIFAADGTQMGVSDDRDIAFAAVRQQGLEPLSVH
ncbi:MAG TPA: DUF1150 family protein [Stellaceae bacterium]|nr:DUF1150 family protein [Stellaceae bacterium]